MTAIKFLLAAAALLLGAALPGSTQAQYPAYPYYSGYAYGYPPYAYAPAPPPSWSYDPYTSGLGPCPQRRSPSDPPCSEQMQPTYGQPSFWPR